MFRESFCRDLAAHLGGYPVFLYADIGLNVRLAISFILTDTRIIWLDILCIPNGDCAISVCIYYVLVPAHFMASILKKYGHTTV